jgi:hypothetical protein
MSSLVSFLVGLLFGLGLIVSGMFNPAKVLGFLDIVGTWDPSLVFVMVGAIAVGFLGFSFAGKRELSLLGTPMPIPQRRGIDKRLLFGSLSFGVGWGLAGFCPGPALVALGGGELKAVVFVISMLAGMMIFEALERLQDRTRAPRANG